jgi:hypothetical protein
MSYNKYESRISMDGHMWLYEGLALPHWGSIELSQGVSSHILLISVLICSFLSFSTSLIQ